MILTDKRTNEHTYPLYRCNANIKTALFTNYLNGAQTRVIQAISYSTPIIQIEIDFTKERAYYIVRKYPTNNTIQHTHKAFKWIGEHINEQFTRMLMHMWNELLHNREYDFAFCTTDKNGNIIKGVDLAKPYNYNALQDLCREFRVM